MNLMYEASREGSKNWHVLHYANCYICGIVVHASLTQAVFVAHTHIRCSVAMKAQRV